MPVTEINIYRLNKIPKLLNIWHFKVNVSKMYFLKF